ncbi:uncharacterized protein LOC131215400 [Anopheles bellator]|uniref:uncharacterized protein LOC131215400 n=1 Tax=Anopheles bellator TaxID=139047 RepID=UPI002648C817|nr:uncharacterized protein LOC131215400 [Anopheles bellator]
MNRARKLWMINAWAVAYLLRNVFCLPCVTISYPRGKLVTKPSKIAHRVLQGLKFVLLIVSIGIGGYWNLSLTFSSYGSQLLESTVSQRFFEIEKVVSYGLPLLVMVGIYYHRMKNGSMVRRLNQELKLLALRAGASQNFVQNWSTSSKWDRYGRLIVKQTIELIALCVLWANLSDTRCEASGQMNVSIIISSLMSILPATILLLVSVEMGIIFSFMALSLANLNRSLDRFVVGRTPIEPGTFGLHDRTRHEDTLLRESARFGAAGNKVLRNLIMQYDKLVDVVAIVVQFYSPTLLLIIGMHFVQFTMQLFLCYGKMSSTTSESVNNDKLGQTLLPLVSAAASLIQMFFIIDTTADFNRKIGDDTVAILDLMTKYNSECLKLTANNAYKTKNFNQSLDILFLIVNRARNDTTLYEYFDLDQTLVMTIIASACSYFIVLIQVM